MTVAIGVVAVKGGAGSGNWGHVGRPGLVGGSGGSAGGGLNIPSKLDSVFAKSDAGKTLTALSEDFDFILFGSAAARAYAGEEMGSLPHDIDVMGISQRAEMISDRWDVRIHPGDPSRSYNIIDTYTDVQIQNFEPGMLVGRQLVPGFATDFRIPTAASATGTLAVTKVQGIDVLSPRQLLDSMHRSGSDHIGAVIRGLDLPSDYIDAKWYSMEYGEKGWQYASNRSIVAVKGGAGSGNWGHAGRPGLLGGSSSAGGMAYQPYSNAAGREMYDWLSKRIPAGLLEKTGLREIVVTSRPEPGKPGTLGHTEGGVVRVNKGDTRTLLHEACHVLENGMSDSLRDVRIALRDREGMGNIGAMERVSVFLEGYYSDSGTRANDWVVNTFPDLMDQYGTIEGKYLQ